MPAVSKKQQRFFGMVRAAQKGELENPSPEVADVANDISVKDAKKFAKEAVKALKQSSLSMPLFIVPFAFNLGPTLQSILEENILSADENE